MTFAFSQPPVLTQKRDAYLTALEAELMRNVQKLKMEGQEPPYFISYRVVDAQTISLTSSQGVMEDFGESRWNGLHVQTRVGNYGMDNSGLEKGQDFSSDEEWEDRNRYSWVNVPIGGDLYALRHLLWQVTDYRYKQAIRDYLERKAKAISAVPDEEEKVNDFSEELALIHLEERIPFSYNQKLWEQKLHAYSSLLHLKETMLSSLASMYGGTFHTYIANSEGSRVHTADTGYVLVFEAFARAADGIPLAAKRYFYAETLENMPSDEILKEAILEIQKELSMLKDSKSVETATGPVLFTGNAAPLVLHELLGHNLRGLKDVNERGFEAGNQILPVFLSVHDDPLAKTFGDQFLSGYYRVDEEGVEARDAVLVEKGILKNFLLSRKPIKGFPNSNGHGRAASHGDPEPHTGNLFVQSAKAYPLSQLKKMLIQECKKQKKDYGFIVSSALIRESGFSLYPFSASKGLSVMPVMMVKVWAKDGREEVVHGGRIVVGSAKEFLLRILAASKETFAANQYCYTGLPTATVSPALLVSEVEIQKDKSGVRKSPVLLPPE